MIYTFYTAENSGCNWLLGAEERLEFFVFQ